MLMSFMNILKAAPNPCASEIKKKEKLRGYAELISLYAIVL